MDRRNVRRGDKTRSQILSETPSARGGDGAGPLAGRVAGLRTKIALAWLATFWERFWPAAWPLTLTLGAFAVLALYGVFARVPVSAHALALAVFAGLTLYLGWRLGRARPWPMPGDALRRIERASAAPHRPLSTLRDRPATTDRDALSLWQSHLGRTARALPPLAVGWPRASLEKRDPLALRAVLGFLLFVGLLAADDPVGRITDGLVPGSGRAGTGGTAEVAVWITPPAYSGLAPTYIENARGVDNTPLRLLRGSVVLAHVSGTSAAPSLSLGGDALAFEALAAGSFRIETRVEAAKRIAIMQGARPLFSRPVEIVADHPPDIAFAAPPTATERLSLRLDYMASDDFGVERAMAELMQRAGPAGAPGGDPNADTLPEDGAVTLSLDLPLAHMGAAENQGTGYHDLTAHPWAGQRVALRLAALDGAGQKGVSPAIFVLLPERVFRHPVARELVGRRKQLFEDPSSGPDVAAALDDIAADPDAYRGDSVVTLALAAAGARLRQKGAAAEIPDVTRTLWDTALRIEDGRLASAEQRLRGAREKLREALSKGETDPAELDRLMGDVQAALDQYLDALAENAPDPSPRPAQGTESQAREVTPDDLRAMMDRIQELNRMGQREAAQQMLRQLEEILENMKTGQPPRAPSETERFAEEAMRDLDDLSRRQRDLMEQGFRQNQRADREPRPDQQGREPERARDRETGRAPGGDRPGQEGAGDTPSGGQDAGRMAADQQQLRRDLGDFMNRLGEALGRIPGGIGDAERSMRQAEDALGRNQPGAAQDSQGEALENLRRGAEELRRDLDRRLAAEGRGTGGGREAGNFGRDPAGGQTGQGETVKIPDEGEMRRAREILDELRRRAGETGRPDDERRYLDRLLEPF